ncbi:hypothetical protein EBZ35_06290 [bacterium]|nr:hypothetical protein [bacterium]
MLYNGLNVGLYPLPTLLYWHQEVIQHRDMTCCWVGGRRNEWEHGRTFSPFFEPVSTIGWLNTTLLTCDDDIE